MFTTVAIIWSLRNNEWRGTAAKIRRGFYKAGGRLAASHVSVCALAPAAAGSLTP